MLAADGGAQCHLGLRWHVVLAPFCPLVTESLELISARISYPV